MVPRRGLDLAFVAFRYFSSSSFFQLEKARVSKQLHSLFLRLSTFLISLRCVVVRLFFSPRNHLLVSLFPSSMGNEASKSGSGGPGPGSTATSAASPASFSSPRVDMDYCWATGYWTVQHENDPVTGVPRDGRRSRLVGLAHNKVASLPYTFFEPVLC